MTIISGLGPRARAFFSDIKGPWGPSGAGDEPEGGDRPQGNNGPWGEPPKRKKGGGSASSTNVTSLDEFLRKGRERFGSGGGGFQSGPSRKLIKWAVRDGRETKPGLKVGICGEHGGDPQSVAFCHRVGLDYVSCSPFRVPVARLAAAHAALSEPAAVAAGVRAA